MSENVADVRSSEAAAAWGRLHQGVLNARKAQFSAPVGWSLVIGLSYHTVPLRSVLVWLAIVIAAFAFILWRCFQLSAAIVEKRIIFLRAYRGYCWLACIDGLAWGSMPFFLMGNDTSLNILLACVLCGVGAVNVLVHIVFYRAYLSLLLIIWGGMVLNFLLNSTIPFNLQLLVSVSACFAVLLFYAHDLIIMVKENFQLKFENEALVEKLKNALSNTQQEAATDPLTGAANRRALMEALEKKQWSVEGGGLPFCVLMLDIDYFKQVNDHHGHSIGDLVLKQFVVRVGESLRSNDLLARYGGEEFVCVLHGAKLKDAIDVAQRICNSIAAQPMLISPVLSITVSIGVAPFQKGTGFAATLDAADKAVYAAKAGGRNQVCAVETETKPGKVMLIKRQIGRLKRKRQQRS